MPSAQLDDRYALAEGTLLRDYTIEAVVGHGGFGIVYRALHNELRHLVAIKEYLPVELAVREGDSVTPRNADCEENYADGLRRFRDEAQALISLNGHPNVVACRDFFRSNGTAYLVMDYVDGQPLSEVLRHREEDGRPFKETDLLAVGVPLAKGLAHVHRARILHRDIKPSNILIRRADQRPVLIDFGAAKQSVAEHTRSLAPYTEGYAALEQVSDGELGPWTDLYGLGAVLWRMVAGGNPPWHPPNPVKVESRAAATLGNANDPLPSACELGASRFDLRILKAIDRSLCLNNSQRIQSCSEFLEFIAPRRVEIDSRDDQIKGTPNPSWWNKLKVSYAGSSSNQTKVLFAIMSVIAVLGLGIYSFYSSQGMDQNARTRIRAIALYSGIKADQDYAESHSLFHAAASNGDFLANMWLARTHYYGRHFPAIRDIKNVRDEMAVGFRPPVSDHDGLTITQDRSLAAVFAKRSVAKVLDSAESGSAEAMFLAASAYQVGLGVEVDPRQAVDLFKESCDNGFLIACHNLALQFLSADDEDGDQKSSDIIQLYQRACDGGFMPSCLNLGDLFRRGEAVDRDTNHAMELFQMACENGNRLGCASLGLLLHHGGKSTSALEYLRRACSGGEPLGCIVMTNLGARYLENSRDEETATIVAELYESACSVGFYRGCLGLGHLLFDGKGIVDSSRAVGLLEGNCDSGHLSSCSGLAILYHYGKGVTLDISRAKELYQIACDGDDMVACVGLGRVLNSQSETPLDTTRAVGLFQTACDSGNAEGCVQLGVAFFLGRGVSQDVRLALELIQKACDSNYESACELLREIRGSD